MRIETSFFLLSVDLPSVIIYSMDCNSVNVTTPKVANSKVSICHCKKLVSMPARHGYDESVWQVKHKRMW